MSASTPTHAHAAYLPLPPPLAQENANTPGSARASKRASTGRTPVGRTPVDREIRSAIKARREAVSGREASPSPMAAKAAPLFDDLTSTTDAPAEAPVRRKMPTPLRNAIAAKAPSSTRIKSPAKPRATTPAASGGGLLAELQRRLSKPALQSHAAAAEAAVHASQSPMETAPAAAAPKPMLPTPLREAIKQRRPTSSGKKSAKPAPAEEAAAPAEEAVAPAKEAVVPPAAVRMALPTPVRKAIAERRASGAGRLSASPAPALRRSSMLRVRVRLGLGLGLGIG